jgi:DNA-binding beta-propeller fold protein YncE
MKRLFVVVVVIAGFNRSPTLPGAPPPRAVSKDGGFILLDNCDPDFRGKATYEDNLTRFDSRGVLKLRISGFNNAESIGTSRRVAVDRARESVWVVEDVARRVRKFSFDGKELVCLPSLYANAIEVDPETGNLWVLPSNGTIYGSNKTVVFSRDGKELATHEVGGFDLAYDKRGKSFWITGKHLHKVSAGRPGPGRSHVLVSRPNIAQWCTSSVAVNPATGQVWVTNREYQPNHGMDELLGFDNDGNPNVTVALTEGKNVVPFHVSVDAKTGMVWVTLFRREVRRYTADGKLDASFKLEASSAHADEATGGAWVVTNTDLVIINAKGEVQRRLPHKRESNQAWGCRY